METQENRAPWDQWDCLARTAPLAREVVPVMTETEVFRVLLATRVCLGSLGCRDFLAKKDIGVCQDRRVKLAPWDHMENLVTAVTLALLDLLVMWDRAVYWAQEADQVLLELLDSLEVKVPLVPRETWDLWDLLVPPDKPDPLDKRDRPAPLDLWDLLVFPAPLVNLACLGSPAPSDPLVYPDLLVTTDLRVTRVPWACRA